MARKAWSQYRLTDEQWIKFKSRSLSGAYKIINLQNGMCYVGSSKEMMSRWKIHRGKLNRGITTTWVYRRLGVILVKKILYLFA